MKNTLAVYGTLLRGFGNNRYYMRTAEFLGEYESDPKFTMYSNGGFPYLAEGGDTRIQMEVYKVDDDTLFALDALEGVDSGHYQRIQIITPFGKTYLYVATDDTKRRIQERLPVVDSGSWRSWINRSAVVLP